MNILNLIVLSIAIVLGSLYGPTEDRDGSVTFTDYLGRSITISRFGTVLSIRNKNGKEIVPANVYRICPCGEKEPCIESATTPSKDTDSKLEVEFPKKGTTLKEGEVLVVTVRFRRGEITVTRRLTWRAGSSSIISEDTITAPKALCTCTLDSEPSNPEPRAKTLSAKMCPAPPGALYTCPPLPESQSSGTQSVTTMVAYRIPEQ